jgi:hypothetical protein
MVTRPPKTDPVTMRVQMSTTHGRRALEIGQRIFTGADRQKAPRGGGQARLRLHDLRDLSRVGHKRDDVPSLEGSLRRDEQR